jgi:hypothetical protein
MPRQDKIKAGAGVKGKAYREEAISSVLPSGKISLNRVVLDWGQPKNRGNRRVK